MSKKFFLSDNKPSYYIIQPLFCVIFLIGCSGPIIRSSQPFPPFIKEYKSFQLDRNNTEFFNTGIQVMAGNYLTLMVKSEMFTRSGLGLTAFVQTKFLAPGEKVVFKIGTDGKPHFTHLGIG